MWAFGFWPLATGSFIHRQKKYSLFDGPLSQLPIAIGSTLSCAIMYIITLIFILADTNNHKNIEK